MIFRAVICKVDDIKPHPNGDKLDLLWISWPDGAIRVITGKHYRKGQFGIYIPAGLTIPGWMAEDMWLFGKGRAMRERFEVRRIELQGLPSPGLFCGEVYRTDPDDQRSVDRRQKLVAEGAMGDGKYVNWPFWRSWWKLGDDVTAYLGITPSAVDREMHHCEAEPEKCGGVHD